MLQVLQIATVITNCDNFITKCDSYHKMRRLLQIATVQFINEVNKKHKTIKFKNKISSQKILFLDTMVYKDKENNLQAALYR